jgi:hypothetical protein
MVGIYIFIYFTLLYDNNNKLIYAFYNDTNKIHHNKRDAWEKLKSINSLNAKHAYVEALLKATTEVITNDEIFKA